MRKVFEKNRQIIIAYHLLSNNEMITSDQLALITDTSSRTVKSDIAYISELFAENGVQIISKRNGGYGINVVDEEKYQQWANYIRSVYFSYAQSVEYSEQMRVIHIMRTLLCSEGYYSLDDFCEELFLSRPVVNGLFSKAKRFLESYNLAVVNKSGSGYKVEGRERDIRMAMIAAYGIQYSDPNKNPFYDKYDEYFDYADEDYQRIRHILLEVLRNEKCSLYDLSIQSMALYLMLMVNRIKNGLSVSLNNKELSVKKLKGYKVVQHIFKALQKEYPQYDVSEDEIAFFAILLITYRDRTISDINRNDLGELYEDIIHCAKLIRNMLEDTYQLNMTSKTVTEEIFYPLCTMVIVRCCYNTISYRSTSYNHMYEMNRFSPVIMAMAYRIGRLIEDKYDCSIERNILLYCANILEYMMTFFPVPYKKRKIHICSSLGKSTAERIGKWVEKTFDKYCEKTVASELFELRGMNPEEVDGVILHMNNFDYKYDFPFFVIDDSNQLDKYIEPILHKLFLENDEINNNIYNYLNNIVVRNINGKDEKDCISKITEELVTNDLTSCRNQLMHDDEIISFNFQNGVAYFEIDKKYTDKNSLYLYQLNKEINWHDHSVNFILVNTIKYSDENCALNKFMLERLSSNVQLINNLIQHKDVSEFFNNTK